MHSVGKRNGSVRLARRETAGPAPSCLIIWLLGDMSLAWSNSAPPLPPIRLILWARARPRWTTQAIRGTEVAEAANRDLRLLAYELGHAFATRRQLPELLSFAVTRCRELLQAEGVAILLLDRENDELYIPYLAEEDPQIAAQLSQIRFPAYR